MAFVAPVFTVLSSLGTSAAAGLGFAGATAAAVGTVAGAVGTAGLLKAGTSAVGKALTPQLPSAPPAPAFPKISAPAKTAEKQKTEAAVSELKSTTQANPFGGTIATSSLGLPGTGNIKRKTLLGG